jgi:hypothetical protein
LRFPKFWPFSGLCLLTATAKVDTLHGTQANITEHQKETQMYSSPKAIDFDAFDHANRLLPWNDPTGLRLRWEAAEKAKELGVPCTLYGRPNVVERMQEAARLTSERNAALGITVVTTRY